MTGRQRAVRRTWAFVAAALGTGLVTILLPTSFVTSPLLVIPAVGSAVLGSVASSILVTAVALSVSTIAGLVHADASAVIFERDAAVLLAGALAAYFAYRLREDREALAMARNRFRLVAENASDIVYTADEHRIITWMAPSIERVLGWNPDEVLGRTIAELVHPEDREATEEVRRRVYAGEDVMIPKSGYFLRLEQRTGGYRWMTVRLASIHHADGTPGGVVGSLTDIDELMAARATAREEAIRLADSEARYRLLAEHSSDVVFLTEASTLLNWVSSSSTVTLGWTPEQLQGTYANDYIHPEDRDLVATTVDASEESGEASRMRFRWRRPDGAYRWMEALGRPFDDDGSGRSGRVVQLRDIERQVEVEEELQQRAQFDDLTGVLKRDSALRVLTHLGHEARFPGRHTAVLFLDLDGFKDVNDTWGHAAGDAMLRVLVDRARGTLRSSDTIARMGGDEFVVCLEGLRDVAEAEVVANKLRTTMARPVSLGGSEFACTVSIGVTLIGRDEEADAVIARADRAMYRAKREGRDRVVTELAVPTSDLAS